MNYLLGSGYYKGNSEEESYKFSLMWARNLIKFTRPFPLKVVVMSVGGSDSLSNKILYNMPCSCDVISLEGNLGHVHHLVHNLKPHAFGGWSASVMALAMIAYNAELDFVYREQDVLAFGPYIEKMYSEIGDGGMIFGNFEAMPCAQSLFLIKHSFIPTFIKDYLSEGGDRDIENLPEHKFAHLQEKFSGYRRFSFGYDRGRPLNMDDPVWYAQRLTPAEIQQLYIKGML